MDAIQEILEADKRLLAALHQLNQPYPGLSIFIEDEVRFRLETIANMILIIRSDLQNMKSEWMKDNGQNRCANTPTSTLP